MLVRKDRKPIIGLTTGYLECDPQRTTPTPKAFNYIKDEYVISVEKAGGIPILIPNLTEPNLLMPIFEKIDGVILTGGGDIDPQIYGESPKFDTVRFNRKRDEIEIFIVKNFKRPILGICRGLQVINVALGGTLYQDIKLELNSETDHGKPDEPSFHNVKIEQNSLLFEIIRRKDIDVNSSHHQGIKRLADGLRATAYAPDNLIEAIESENGEIIGVQWHPESLNDEHSEKLFEWFIRRCGGM